MAAVESVLMCIGYFDMRLTPAFGSGSYAVCLHSDRARLYDMFGLTLQFHMLTMSLQASIRILAAYTQLPNILAKASDASASGHCPEAKNENT